MAYIVDDAFFKVDDRGNHKRVAVGTRLTNAQFNKLNKIKQSKCSPLPNIRDRVYSQIEANDLMFIYLNVDGLANQVAAFLQKHPTRNPAGVECQLRIIAGQDNTTDDRGLQNPATSILRAMMMQAPHRFV